jgi:putative ABC transport system substrate-binding protein
MKRRELLIVLGGAAVTWPLAARGQHTNQIRQIGMLMAYAENDREGQAFVTNFREGLEKIGVG